MALKLLVEMKNFRYFVLRNVLLLHCYTLFLLMFSYLLQQCRLKTYTFSCSLSFLSSGIQNRSQKREINIKETHKNRFQYFPYTDFYDPFVESLNHNIQKKLLRHFPPHLTQCLALFESLARNIINKLPHVCHEHGISFTNYLFGHGAADRVG